MTVAYLLVSALLLFVRRSEFGLGCETSDTNCGSLQLNDIGDVAAGIFAPLAFLWLFVATQLQRRELSLQRAELAETRAVLADQQRELEISAKESAHQTEIMRRTLDATMSRTVYDEFNLRLYFLAKIWMQLHGRTIYLDTGDEATSSLLHFMHIGGNGVPFQENPSSIDSFYEMFLRRVQQLVARQEEERGVLKAVDRDRYSVIKAFHLGMPVFRELMEKVETESNLLVRARVEGLDLESLIYQLEFINDIITQDYSETHAPTD
ncbi:hypothetical protein [Methylorubrum extorquens]